MNNLTFDDVFYKEEIRSGYPVTEKEKKVWAVQLDLMKQFMEVCDRESIRYYAAGGTLLGAIRHKGFIPWDDDVDFFLPRKDYDRLCECAPGAFAHPYFFQTAGTDPGFDRSFARLRNSETTAIPNCDLHADLPYNQGIFIDILPLDNIPDDPKEREKWAKKHRRLRRKAHTFSLASFNYRTEFEQETVCSRLRFLSGPILSFARKRCHLPNPYLRRFEKLARKYNNTNTKEWTLVWAWAPQFFCEKADFGEGAKAPFEMLEIHIPDQSVHLLKKHYGDWENPLRSASQHRPIYFDPDRPYRDYVRSKI